MPNNGSDAAAFNAGSDARLIGRHATANPYPMADFCGCRAWLRGWMDVDIHWGKHAKWPCRKLPMLDDNE